MNYNFKIGDTVVYVDPINYEEYECTIVFIEPGDFGIVFVYLKSVEPKLNIYTDPKFTDMYFTITNSTNLLEN